MSKTIRIIRRFATAIFIAFCALFAVNAAGQSYSTHPHNKHYDARATHKTTYEHIPNGYHVHSELASGYKYHKRFEPQFAQSQLSKREVKHIVMQQIPSAHVLDIRLLGAVYKVRVQTKDGVVRDVLVDAVTGRVQ